MNKLLLIENDPWLWPVASCIENRHEEYVNTKKWIESDYGSLYNFASAHLYYGLHLDKQNNSWTFREWLPNAKDVFLTGDFNDWDLSSHPLHKSGLNNGDWEIVLDPNVDPTAQKLVQGSCYKIYVHQSDGQWRMRMPAYSFYTEQDPNTKDFKAKIWQEVQIKNTFYPKLPKKDLKNTFTPLIYEAHIGMAQEKEEVGSYTEFKNNILPRIEKDGYNVLQLMGIAEHPYYGSFGYHVSNFFAPSSRFGNPDELRELVAEAHKRGILVVMDIVHAHFVANINEGLFALDGSSDLYSYPEPKGTHPFWGSKMFRFDRNELRRFLLSNLRYWIESFGFDGFRFDGVTAMIYFHRGYTKDFGNYQNYFGNEVDNNALIYLKLANDLIDEIDEYSDSGNTEQENATLKLSIAEEVSGMPGTTYATKDGGLGFDARLSMGIPDFWIKLIKERRDEDWCMAQIWETLNDRLANVPQIAYCESHDQALVGDQTLAFRLMGNYMYSGMEKNIPSVQVDRGLALHKMIRLITLAVGSGGGGYLNFMGNEFGHPEWIDFPREGNNWSYQYARRQWSLADSPNLKYNYFLNFDQKMIAWAKEINLRTMGAARLLHIDEENKILAFDLKNGEYVLAFNFNVCNSFNNYPIPVSRPGDYSLLFSTDDANFGGFSRLEANATHFTQNYEQSEIGAEKKTFAQYIYTYLVSRSAIVWKFNIKS